MSALTNSKHEAFCQFYMVCFNASEAARQAGYSVRSAAAIGNDLLRKPEIIARLAELRAEQSKRLEIDADDILGMWWHQATANANDLTQHRIGACRYCHGHGHAYQWRTDREYQVARVKWSRTRPKGAALDDDGRDATMPSLGGGMGFRSTNPPHPDCPECDGLGLSVIIITDTTKLSPQALALYRGVKQTQHGLEILTADQGKALENVARRFGLMKEFVEVDTGDRLTNLFVDLAKRANAAPLRPSAASATPQNGASGAVRGGGATQ